MKALVGEVTCNIITCPTCSTRLQVCYQALSPEYLIENAQCPVCGTVVANWALSIEVYSYQPAEAMTEMIAAIMPLFILIAIVMMIAGIAR